MPFLNDTVEAASVALSSKAMYGGSAVATGSWAACKVPFLQQLMVRLGALDASDVFGGIGATVAIIGLISNIWFNWRRDRREQAKATAEA